MENGWTTEAQEFAHGTLMALGLTTDRCQGSHSNSSTGGAKPSCSEHVGGVSSESKDTHLMLSYNWTHKEVIRRIGAELKARQYTCWIDVERMQGSTIDAMVSLYPVLS